MGGGGKGSNRAFPGSSDRGEAGRRHGHAMRRRGRTQRRRRAPNQHAGEAADAGTVHATRRRTSGTQSKHRGEHTDGARREDTGHSDGQERRGWRTKWARACGGDNRIYRKVHAMERRHATQTRRDTTPAGEQTGRWQRQGTQEANNDAGGRIGHRSAAERRKRKTVSIGSQNANANERGQRDTSRRARSQRGQREEAREHGGEAEVRPRAREERESNVEAARSRVAADEAEQGKYHLQQLEHGTPKKYTQVQRT